MEEASVQQKNSGPRRYIIVPVIIAVIAAAILFYFDSRKNSPENNQSPDNVPISDYRPKPVSREENPRRSESLILGIGCVGPENIKAETLKQPDAVWEIKKSGEITTVSLGKYRLYAPQGKIFDIPKFWLYFYSEKLGREDDGLYGLEASYVSGIRLTVNDFEKKINLGGDEYMLIELDYPLGDLYPYDKSAMLDYEFLIDLKCKNIKDGKCLSNNGKPLDFLNGTEIISSLRTFARGCQEFNSGELEGGDQEISAKFKY